MPGNSSTEARYFFFDSYAIIEILRGNPLYDPYLSAIILTTKLNIFEVYSSILREAGQDEADFFLEKYSKFTIDYDIGIIREAAKLWLEHKKRNLSMADCIGVAIAKAWGIPMLTGDRGLKDFKEVVFVGKEQ